MNNISFGISAIPRNNKGYQLTEYKPYVSEVPIDSAIDELLDEYIALSNIKNRCKNENTKLRKSKKIDDLYLFRDNLEQIENCNKKLDFTIHELKQISEELKLGKKFHSII